MNPPSIQFKKQRAVGRLLIVNLKLEEIKYFYIHRKFISYADPRAVYAVCLCGVGFKST